MIDTRIYPQRIGQVHASEPGLIDLHEMPTGTEKLLLVDDDHEFCAEVRAYLQERGYSVECVHSGSAGVASVEANRYDLLMLDLALPDADGLDLLQQIRQECDTSIMVLTGRGDEVDRVLGLELGADDYVCKPLSLRELLARIRAILRRAMKTHLPQREKILVGDLELDVSARCVCVQKHTIELTSTEFDLLRVLLRHAGSAVSRDALSREVFDRRFLPEDRSVDVHISNIRRKLQAVSSETRKRIKTLRGTGYVYVLEPLNGDVELS